MAQRRQGRRGMSAQGGRGDVVERDHELRPLLFSIAYRMTGSVGDAEDLVQETFLRYERAAPTAVESPKAYLSAVVTRLAIDHLRSARVRREQYVGEWLPEPLVADATPHAAETADELSLAFLARARDALAGRARGVPPARGVRLPVRRDRRRRRQERGQRAPDRDPSAPARRRAPAAVRGVAPPKRDELADRFFAAAADGDTAALARAARRGRRRARRRRRQGAADRGAGRTAPSVPRGCSAGGSASPPELDARTQRVTVNGQPGASSRRPPARSAA